MAAVNVRVLQLLSVVVVVSSVKRDSVHKKTHTYIIRTSGNKGKSTLIHVFGEMGRNKEIRIKKQRLCHLC